MNDSQYAAAFLENMELVPYLTPIEQSKVERFANGLPTDFGPMLKIATTLETTISVAKSLEEIANGITTNTVEVGRKRIMKSPQNLIKRIG